MQQIDKYYTFHIKLSSPDTPGFNPGHYVIYIRKVLSIHPLELEFYFASSNAAEDYASWMAKIPAALDKDECKGYAARKYEDDIVSRIGSGGEYIPVGRIQYADFMVEIVLKKSQHSTEVYFVSGNKKKLDGLIELVDIELSEMSMYGIKLERGPLTAETQDKSLIDSVKKVNQLIIVGAGDVARVY